MAITRHGINRQDTGPLMKCSFEETVSENKCIYWLPATTVYNIWVYCNNSLCFAA